MNYTEFMDELEQKICQKIAEQISGKTDEDKIRRQGYSDAISVVHNVMKQEKRFCPITELCYGRQETEPVYERD